MVSIGVCERNPRCTFFILYSHACLEVETSTISFFMYPQNPKLFLTLSVWFLLNWYLLFLRKVGRGLVFIGRSTVRAFSAGCLQLALCLVCHQPGSIIDIWFVFNYEAYLMELCTPTKCQMFEWQQDRTME